MKLLLMLIVSVIARNDACDLLLRAQRLSTFVNNQTRLLIYPISRFWVALVNDNIVQEERVAYAGFR